MKLTTFAWPCVAAALCASFLAGCGAPPSGTDDGVAISAQPLDAPQPLQHYRDLADALIKYSPNMDVYERDKLIVSAYAKLYLKDPDVYRYPGLAMNAGWEAGIIMKL